MAAEIDKTETKTQELSPVGARRPASSTSRTAVKTVRSVAIFGTIGALVAAIAFPAFANGTGSQAEAASTLHQVAADNSQSIVVASEASAAPTDREEFTATTAEELEQKKAEEAAAARAAAMVSNAGGSPAGLDLTMTSPGSGEVRWPMLGGSYNVGEGLGAGRGHQGQDMLAPEWTPIFAATSGTVRVAQDDYFGYGNAVVIDGVVGGNAVSTTYAHMVYGGRVVEPGQQVSAGQLIGHVGNTGRSFGSHLHFEVQINGSIVDPLSWLSANAG